VATGLPFAVTNTSPIIALAGVAQLGLLGALFERLMVPFGVWYELVDKPGAHEPAMLMALRNVTFLPAARPAPVQTASLHLGEQEAITLALAHPGAWVLLDEAAARKVAAGLGLAVRGTLGILLEAKRRGLIDAVGPLIEGIITKGCYFDTALVQAVLVASGEGRS
jgi:predicted nucleic acid-binding protein